MDIKGTTRVCGLIGNPVGHSISPVIHNTLADITKTNMVYTTFKVDKEDVAKAVEGAYALDILGLNVTVPHKQGVMDVLVDIDPLAKAIGAVNTLVRKDGGYKGYNTDILGLKRELEDESISLCGNNCIILGAGGAARAIAFLCAQSGANKVYMLNRTIEKAENISLVQKYVAQILNEREKEIIVWRYGLDGKKPMTQKKVGEKLGISRSYVSRIEKRALEKLKKALDNSYRM